MSKEFWSIIRERRNIRQYSTREVTGRIILHLLEAGQWAPSAHNIQPWRFIVIAEQSTKNRLAKAMATKWNEDMRKMGINPLLRERKTQKSINTFTRAPILILVCLNPEEGKESPIIKREELEYVMGVQSVAAAIENIILTAQAKGLGAGWFCAPLYCPKVVREILEIPEKVHPQALITIGYPKEEPKKSSRIPLKAIVHFEKWGKKK
jgi:F420 biosynthesis protein FbiB-like protein